MAAHLVDFAATGAAAEPDVADILRSYTGCDPRDLRFERLTLLLDEVRDSITAPESYLLDGDRRGYDSVLYFIERYQSGNAVNPIIVRIADDGVDVIDGFHRLAAADAAGMSSVEAFSVRLPA